MYFFGAEIAGKAPENLREYVSLDLYQNAINILPLHIWDTPPRLLDINRDDRSQRSFIYLFQKPKDLLSIDCNETSDPNNRDIRRNLFVDQMDEQLFRQLDSTLIMLNENHTEVVLLFTIDSRPKYRIQYGVRNISLQVRH